MENKITKKEWNAMRDYVNYAMDHPDEVPDTLIVLPFNTSEISSILTNKRRELITHIRGNNNSLSISELSKKLKREVSAVQRDVSLLEDYGIIEIEKDGKKSIPIVKGEFIVLPMESDMPRRLDRDSISEDKVIGSTWMDYPTTLIDSSVIEHISPTLPEISPKTSFCVENVDEGSISHLSPTIIPIY